MACAHRLRDQADVHLFEAEQEPGGHTHTVDVDEGGNRIPIDTGFMVYNEVTYPLLTALFDELKVQTRPTDMSFSVQNLDANIEFNGSSLNQIFAQRRNLVRPTFWRMLRDIVRFNNIANDLLASGQIEAMSLAEFIKQHDFGPRFLDSYLLPMTSAIWSTPPDEMLAFPAHSLLRFLHNHGLLGMNTQHQWRTVVGGSRSYRDIILHPFKDRLHCGTPVVSVQRHENNHVSLHFSERSSELFDYVIIATHADTALRILHAPLSEENRLLSAFPYAQNSITLHSDSRVMPRRKRAWASWNYSLKRDPSGGILASTHYWMNSLQKVSDKTQYFVSVNAISGTLDPDKIHKCFQFDHPMFDTRSADAQKDLPHLNTLSRVLFCGSYFRYGFHEDGLMAGYAAADALIERTR